MTHTDPEEPDDEFELNDTDSHEEDDSGGSDDVLRRVLSRATVPGATVFRDLTKAEALDEDEQEAFRN